MIARKYLARSGTPRLYGSIPFAALALSALIAVTIAGCGSKAADNAGAPPPPEVSVATVLT
jgi:multidrug efflux system membrane fusion protein